MANVYLLMPGIPFIYYGEEIGMLGSGVDENKRLSFIWSDTNTEGMCSLLANSDYTKRRYAALDEQQKDSNSLFNHYKKVLEVRNNHSSLVNGKAELFDTNNDAVYGVISRNDKEDILVIHNFGKSVNEITVEGYKLSESITLNNEKVNNKDGVVSLPAQSSSVFVKEG